MADENKPEVKICFGGEFDKLNRKDFAIKLTTAVDNFYPFHDGAYVLSLNASYGNGKTTFLDMWQDYLENSPEAGGHKVIRINAWETDFDDEPIIPIASALIEAIQADKKAEKVVKLLNGALAAAISVGNDVLKNKMGVDLEKAGRAALNETELQAIGGDVSKNFSLKKKAYENLRIALEGYVKTLDKKPLIIMVDELDRVRPNYAVSFLEAIKHIFSIKGICFVLTVDKEQIKASVKQLYGEIDFDNYYLRFITREASLPPVSRQELGTFVLMVMDNYFCEGKVFAFDNTGKDALKLQAQNIINLFDFSLRKAELLFRVYFQFVLLEGNSKEKLYISWLQGSLFLVAMSISGKYVDEYKKLGTGLFSPKDIEKMARNMTKELSCNNEEEKAVVRNVILSVLPFSLSKNNENFLTQAAEVVYRHGGDLKEHSKEEILDVLGRKYDNWERFGEISGFEKMYKKLESWKGLVG